MTSCQHKWEIENWVCAPPGLQTLIFAVVLCPLCNTVKPPFNDPTYKVQPFAPKGWKGYLGDQSKDKDKP
jgi:hypothetical protein